MNENETLETMVARFAALAVGTLRETGSHSSTLFIVGEKAAGVILAEMPDPGASRHATFASYGQQVRLQAGERIGPLVAIVHVAEAWGRTLTTPEEREAFAAHREHPYLKDDPQREEVLIVTGYNPSLGECVLWMYDMVRDAAGTLVDVRRRPDPDDAHDAQAAPLLLEAFAAGYEGRTPKDFHFDVSPDADAISHHAAQG